MSHTVVFEKPDRAHLIASAGFASTSPRTVAKATPVTPDGGGGNRLEHEPDHDRAEEREEVPRRRLQAGRDGQQGDDHAEQDGEKALPERGVRVKVDMEERGFDGLCMRFHRNLPS